jgi:hypothetical protein
MNTYFGGKFGNNIDEHEENDDFTTAEEVAVKKSS